MKGARVTARRTAEAVAEGRSPKAVGCGAAHKVSVFLKRAGGRGSDEASTPERLKDPMRTRGTIQAKASRLTLVIEPKLGFSQAIPATDTKLHP